MKVGWTHNMHVCTYIWWGRHWKVPLSFHPCMIPYQMNQRGISLLLMSELVGFLSHGRLILSLPPNQTFHIMDLDPLPGPFQILILLSKPTPHPIWSVSLFVHRVIPSSVLMFTVCVHWQNHACTTIYCEHFQCSLARIMRFLCYDLYIYFLKIGYLFPN